LAKFQRIQQNEPLLALLTLKGSKICSQAIRGCIWTFGVANQGNVGLNFPSGGLRGSDFEMWFWKNPYSAPVLP
jgi:hypothetical protein